MNGSAKATPFFGWRVVWAAFLLAIFGWGVGFYGPPVFLHAVLERTGWPLAFVSGAVTFHFLVGAAVVANLPRLYERFGLPVITTAGALSLALGVLGWALAAQPWQLIAAALFSGAGWVAMGAAALNAIVAPWFQRRRPAALSTAYNGSSLGGVLLSPLWAFLIAVLGFAPAALLVGTVMVALVWTLSASVFSKTPADLGQADSSDSAPSSGSAITLPRALAADVSYPAEAEGDATVVLELLVSKEGRIERATAVSGPEPFASAAQAAALNWRFEPARQGEAPIAARIRFRVRFIEETQQTPDTEAQTESAEAKWYVSADKDLFPAQTLRVDFQGVQLNANSFGRFFFNKSNSNFLEIDSYDRAQLRYSTNDYLLPEDVTNFVWDATATPWYAAEIQFDYISDKIRARIGARPNLATTNWNSYTATCRSSSSG